MVSTQALVALSTIGVYTVIVLALGYQGWRVGKLNVEDWVTADRSLGVVVLLFTYAATYHSSFAFLGAAGFVYENGIGFFPAAFAWVTLSGILLWLVGSRVWLLGKKYDYVTPSDLLEDFYDSKAVGLLASVVFIVFTFPYVAIQLIGSGIIFETATDGAVSFEAGAAFLLVVGVIYVWLGGMRSIAWTDTIQGVFMFAAMWIAGALFVFSAYRGPSAFWSDLQANAAEYLVLPGPVDALTPAFFVSFVFVTGVGVAMSPHIFLRYYSAKSPRTIKWVAAGGTGYLLLFYLPLAFLALGAVVHFPELADADSAIPVVLYEFTPAVFASVVVAGAIAASMSSKDAQLHAVASLITRDWYENLLADGEVDEVRKTRMAQALVLVLALVSYVIAIQDVDIIVMVTLVAFDGLTQLLPMTLGALYWHRASTEGAFVGLAAGVGIAAVLTFGVVSLPAGAPNFTPGFYGFIVNSILFVGISLLVDPVPAERRERIQGYLAYAINREWEEESGVDTPADD
ncbi:sodium:solute symporter family protein [Natrononativus amylolyticus]|uniref:sodium:solute symporter family protein n=1 Tax=Natrononativus amylolyticus TaxID=2963434 RepID=UPI0020CBC8AA|nr:sodium:solute symporter family protein [Natrononativus amylolyticus]